MNYVHTDDAGPYQALLMLSQPGVDYSGGELFVCKKSDGDDNTTQLKQTSCAFENAGDLIIFSGDKDEYLHGMSTVVAPPPGGRERDEDLEPQRFAVGFFQRQGPAPKKKGGSKKKKKKKKKAAPKKR